ncbi:MAG: glucokinase [Chloroflexi bacterium]|nr:glucokinase [Chloroflexota bacterium]
MILAGDVGGTKTLLAIYVKKNNELQLALKQRFLSANYAGLEHILAEFLPQVREQGLTIERAAFGVAGPVFERHVKITNLPWIITLPRLQDALGLERVSLINDVQAIAYAAPHLEAGDLHTLHEGEPMPGGNIAIIAPGTGLGEAYLTWDGEQYHAYASEGGHADFGPTDALEIELLRYYLLRMDHVSYERFCSGSGLPNIYAFLRENRYAMEPDWLRKRLEEADDPTPVIVEAALKEDPYCELCSMTLSMFVSILAAEAGNLALKVNARGGVYLGGGAPPRILPALMHQRFMQSFLHKGRMADLLIRMPVHVITHPNPGLYGAALYAQDGEKRVP